jgi:hypothetical protein
MKDTNKNQLYYIHTEKGDYIHIRTNIESNVIEMTKEFDNCKLLKVLSKDRKVYTVEVNLI